MWQDERDLDFDETTGIPYTTVILHPKISKCFTNGSNLIESNVNVKQAS